MNSFEQCLVHGTTKNGEWVGKKKYDSEEKALRFALKNWKRHGNKQRAYECRACRFWHLATID